MRSFSSVDWAFGYGIPARTSQRARGSRLRGKRLTADDDRPGHVVRKVDALAQLGPDDREQQAALPGPIYQ